MLTQSQAKHDVSASITRFWLEANEIIQRENPKEIIFGRNVTVL